jgi:NADP-dependent 3-hydroxy acid dehydrogenase YdfG
MDPAQAILRPVTSSNEPVYGTPSALDRRTCVVTGASSGIGRAIAVALAGAGATVWAVARRIDELRSTAALARDPGRIELYAADLSIDAHIGSLASDVGRGAEGVDVLVHSAGAYSRDPIRSAPIDDLDQQYRINLRTPYLLTQALLPALRARRGQIVFINSTVVFSAAETVSQFAATQHALRSFADTLRQEVNPDGIRVASVYPGRTATPRQARIHALEGKPYAPERLLQPADIADVVLKILTVPSSVEITDVRVRPTLKS